MFWMNMKKCMHTETILAWSFFFVWSFKKVHLMANMNMNPNYWYIFPLKFLFKALFIQKNIKNLWVMLQVCRDTDSSCELCVLCSDLNVLSNFIRFSNNKFHDKSVELFSSHYLDRCLTADRHIFATFHWTYSKLQFTSSIMEQSCTLHTIFCWTSYFGIKIQNSKFKPEQNEDWIWKYPHICTLRGMQTEGRILQKRVLKK